MTTSAHIRSLLRARYQHPEWALCFEVANATGGNARRYADAFAMNLFPSRGLAMHGFEIKVSKSDFKNEIANPEKSAAVQQYCDHWWIVAPASAVDESLLPKTWGWMRVDDTKLVIVKQAPELEAKPVTRAFMAALVRRANEVDASEIDEIVRKRVRAERDNDEERIKREVASRAAKADQAMKKIEELKAKIGTEHWDYLDADEVAAAVKFVRACGVAGTYRGMRTLQRDLKCAAGLIEKAFASVNGEQIELPMQAAE